MSAMIKRVSEVGTVTAAAGSTHRRGSVLVLVVGVLALMGIIVVVYTTIGQADARGGRVAVAKSRLDDQSKAIGNYIAGVIADNASAVYPQRVYTASGAGFEQYSARQAWDYPYTGRELRSIVANTPAGVTVPATEAAQRRFNATGTTTHAWPAGSLTQDPRGSFDPWLACTEPTWINDTGTLSMPTPQELLMSHRSWRHISDIAPDGRVVNLATLRGNFGAKSGFRATPYAAPSGTDRVAVSDFLYRFTPGNYGAGTGLAALDSGSFEDVTNLNEYNAPSTWTNDQHEMFRPVGGVFNASFQVALGDPRHPDNMYADATGTGFYNARWQELVDASDMNNPIGMLAPIGGGGGAQGMRFFVAPAIIDLSSMVNVNTAVGMSSPPSINFPAGLTPGDVDLERLLATVDARQYFGINPATQFNQPASMDGNYEFLNATTEQITKVGRAAWAGVLLARTSPDMRPFQYPFTVDRHEGVNWDSSGLFPRPSVLERLVGDNASATNYITAGARAELYKLGAGDPRFGSVEAYTGASGAPETLALSMHRAFGMGEEKELRARNGINDDSAFSALEAATESRFTEMYQLGALRAGRDLLTERDNALAEMTADPTRYGVWTGSMMAQYFADTRHLLTTTSGGRPLMADAVRAPSPGNNVLPPRAIGSSEVRPDINELIARVFDERPSTPNLSRQEAVTAIFKGYASALMPVSAGYDKGNLPAQAVVDAAWADAGNKRSLCVNFGGLTYNPSTGQTNTPTFQGHAAEVALRSAAHLTVNLLQWRDEGRWLGIGPARPDRFGEDAPVAASLLIKESGRANMLDRFTGAGTAPYKFPYWAKGNSYIAASNGVDEMRDRMLHVDNTTDYGAPRALALDLNENDANNGRLMSTSADDPNVPEAVNIFAARPQPFLTQMASFVMYTDTPEANGGDGEGTGSANEWEVTTRPDGTVTVTEHGATIKGNIDTANPDYLCSMIAFQITNPFAVEIPLYDPTKYVLHSIEFGGKFYRLAGEDAATHARDNARVITLKPHESRVFYALSQNPSAIKTRWAVTAPARTVQDVENWIKKQLTLVVGTTTGSRSFDPERIFPVNPETNADTTVTSGINKLLVETDNGNKDENRQALLWREVYSADASETIASGPVTANNLSNDYLIDRLRDPRIPLGADPEPILYRKLRNGQNHIGMLQSWPEPRSPYYDPATMPQDDNEGVSITLWGSVQRRRDPERGPIPSVTGSGLAVLEPFPIGALPAYCMESRLVDGYFSMTNADNVASFNADIQVTSLLELQDQARFSNNMNYDADLKLNKLVLKQLANVICPDVATHPSMQPALADAYIGNNFDGKNWKDDHLATQLPVVPRRTLNGTNPEPRLPPLRPADLLMPWAIGPYENPAFDASRTDPDRLKKLNARWTTLSEAMSMGLKYSRAGGSSSILPGAEKRYEWQAGHVFDRARLPLHAFVPFNDLDNDGQWTQSTAPDPSIFRGTTFAASVLDQFRTMPYGSIEAPVYGTVNINTAPLTVLRTLPLVTGHAKNVLTSSPDDKGGFQDIWTNGDTLGAAAEPLFEMTDRNNVGAGVQRATLWGDIKSYDAAAGIAAYRDQLAVVSTDDGGAVGNTPPTRIIIDGSDGNDTTTVRDPRRKMTGVINTQEMPGFRSVGEVVSAVVKGGTARTASVGAWGNREKGVGVDRFEHEVKGTPMRVDEHYPAAWDAPNRQYVYPANRAHTPMGVSAMTTVVDGLPEGRHFANGTAGTYEQRLAIANALLNTISVRSDFFCAYFMVRGYQPSDTDGLKMFVPGSASAASAPAGGDEALFKPMVPSVQRRYVMVVDRSNCKATGDRPRILMFEEVPVK